MMSQALWMPMKSRINATAPARNNARRGWKHAVHAPAASIAYAGDEGHYDELQSNQRAGRRADDHVEAVPSGAEVGHDEPVPCSARGAARSPTVAARPFWRLDIESQPRPLGEGGTAGKPAKQREARRRAPNPSPARGRRACPRAKTRGWREAPDEGPRRASPHPSPLPQAGDGDATEGWPSGLRQRS